MLACTRPWVQSPAPCLKKKKKKRCRLKGRLSPPMWSLTGPLSLREVDTVHSLFSPLSWIYNLHSFLLLNGLILTTPRKEISFINSLRLGYISKVKQLESGKASIQTRFVFESHTDGLKQYVWGQRGGQINKIPFLSCILVPGIMWSSQQMLAGNQTMKTN